jgi:hypothetical protein
LVAARKKAVRLGRLAGGYFPITASKRLSFRLSGVKVVRGNVEDGDVRQERPVALMDACDGLLLPCGKAYSVTHLDGRSVKASLWD